MPQGPGPAAAGLPPLPGRELEAEGRGGSAPGRRARYDAFGGAFASRQAATFFRAS